MLLIGGLAAVLIGLSKSAVPGAGLLAAPLLALVVSGRAIAGTMLPMLLVADVLAVWWFGRHCRVDVLRPMVWPVIIGFIAGAAFFALIGSASRPLEIVLGLIILALVAIQSYRMVRKAPPVDITPAVTRATGISGGFSTFVANASGPILNTYILALRLPKEELIGTSAWFYFVVNAAKIPAYLVLAYLTVGGPFFTAESLMFNAVLTPLVIAGAWAGRYLLAVISQELFNAAVLLLSAVAAVMLIVGN